MWSIGCSVLFIFACVLYAPNLYLINIPVNMLFSIIVFATIQHVLIAQVLLVTWPVPPSHIIILITWLLVTWPVGPGQHGQVSLSHMTKWVLVTWPVSLSHMTKWVPVTWPVSLSHMTKWVPVTWPVSLSHMTKCVLVTWPVAVKYVQTWCIAWRFIPSYVLRKSTAASFLSGREKYNLRKRPVGLSYRG